MVVLATSLYAKQPCNKLTFGDSKTQSFLAQIYTSALC